MSLYHHIPTGELREFDAARMAALKQAGNPKADGWQLAPAQPTHDPATQHLPVWQDGGWVVRDKTAEELAADMRKTWTSYQFLKRFTPAERKAVRVKAKSDDLVDDFLMLCSAAQQVVSDDSDTVAGMGYLVTVGAITEARKVEILTAP